ncbi:hypothetical protein CCMA1212_002225 [Trichoderma ghanense]|uniref:Uncharacterized protein n=1 Tax=Trichoderma ghanense TaxID=65468 RepID=A0ABY2HEN9_9HYPO
MVLYPVRALVGCYGSPNLILGISGSLENTGSILDTQRILTVEGPSRAEAGFVCTPSCAVSSSTRS